MPYQSHIQATPLLSGSFQALMPTSGVSDIFPVSSALPLEEQDLIF
jgi:hypothetical protein